MRLIQLPGLVVALIVAAAAAATVSATESIRIGVAVVAPADDQHLAWAAAAQLQRAAKERGLEIDVEPASVTGSDNDVLPELLIMPVRSLATQVPALEILELPFFYPSLGDVHERLDGALGEHLSEETRKRGWGIIAYWDEGLHVFSGLKPYDRVRNLKAREFLITRADPVAEKQFQYWKADVRRIRPEDRAAVLRECLLANRAATMQEVVREGLYQVHLYVSRTNHRYEGWVVVAPAERWAKIDTATREKLVLALSATTAWQRNDARQREAAALDDLKRRGMIVHEVDAEQREAFRKLLPDWAELLSDQLDAEQKRKLVGLASPVSRRSSPAAAETGGDRVPKGAPAN